MSQGGGRRVMLHGEITADHGVGALLLLGLGFFVAVAMRILKAVGRLARNLTIGRWTSGGGCCG